MPEPEKLDALRTSVTTISRNLMEFGETEAVKTVRARFKDPVNGYAGLTKDKLAQALKTLDGLWDSYLLLARLLERASGVVKKTGLFHSTEGELKELLEGPSVELPAEHIPITSRGLLASSEATERTTPDELLKAMGQQFEAARDCIGVIYGAITQARPRLAAIGQQVVTLGNWAKGLGTPSRLLPSLDASLAGLDGDPLSCMQGLDQLEALLDQERTRLQAIEEERATIRQGLDQARTRVGELKELASRSLSAIAEAREKIRQPEGLVQPVSDDAIASLAAWLDSLEGNAAAGRYGAVKVGLEKWQSEGEALLTLQRQGYAKNRAALDERAELRGRFKALQAKAAALAAKGMPQSAMLAGLAQEADQALNGLPFDLKTGRCAVESYESALRTQINLNRQNNT